MQTVIQYLQTHQAEVRSFLYRMTAHRQDAEDLSQEVWLRVHRKLPAFEGVQKFLGTSGTYGASEAQGWYLSGVVLGR